jgi:hypothetical protein
MLSATKPVKRFIVLHRIMASSAGPFQKKKRQMHISQFVWNCLVWRLWLL